jgi:hypothetical protein
MTTECRSTVGSSMSRCTAANKFAQIGERELVAWYVSEGALAFRPN